MLGAPILAVAAAVGQAAAPAEPLRYALAAGDHLVYRETFERAVRSGTDETVVRYVWRSHVLVADVRPGRLAVGFQRNRLSADVVRAREGGSDRLEDERGRFAARMARVSPRFAEANLLDESGHALGPWSAAREAHSELLFGVHELEPLPREPVSAGARWRAGSLLGFEYRLAGAAKDDPGCRVIEGRAPGDQGIRVTLCDGSGPARIEMEGRYSTPAGEVSETLRFERETVTRGEDVAAWLGDPDLALGVLAVADRAPWLAVAPEALHRLAASEDVDLQRAALALAWRRRLTAPPAERLAALARSSDLRVAALARRLAGEAPSREPAACLPPPTSAALVAGTTFRFMEGSRRGWPYVLHVPEEYRGDEPLPLLVYLGGGPGRALLALGTARSAIEGSGMLAVVPHADGMWWSPASEAMLDALLDEVFAKLRVDRDRVYLAGASNGASGAWRLAARRPDLFAAVSLLMGAGPAVDATPEPAAALDGLDLLMQHGSDDEVIPARFHRRSVEELKSKAPGARLEEEVLRGRGHDLNPNSDDGRTMAFFAGKAREAFPRRVRLVTRRPSRRAWLEVMELDGGVAELDAALEPGVIRVTARGVRRARLLLRRELVPPGETLRVEVNGKPAWEGVVTEDGALLARTCAETRDPARAWSMAIDLEVR